MSLIIGIDPDVTKSGVAIYSKQTKTIQYKSLSFFDLLEYLKSIKDSVDLIKIEGGWINKKSNFRNTKIKNISDAISRKVGENHGAGKKIVEMCEYLNIKNKVSKPLLKRWKGLDGKITHSEIIKLLEPLKIEIGNKSNQDQRDAILICLF